MRTKVLHYLTPTKILKKFGPVIILSLLMGFPRIVLGQLQILGSNPEQASILANSTAGIDIAFNRAVDLGTLLASVKVYGSYHGLYDLTFDFDTVSNILHILPSPAFIDGESVTVILTTALRATDGSRLERSYRLAFRTQNRFGNVLSGFEILDIPLLPGDQQPAKIALGDFDHDDFIDAAVVNSTSNTVTILTNTTRTQRFTTLSPSESYSTGITPIDIATADFDADGNLDLAVANFASNTISIHWGNNDGSFRATPTTIAVGLRPSGIAVDDFNGDGIIDFAISLFGEDKVSIYTNNGNGNFTLSTDLDAEEGTFGIASADFDGDGDADLAAINNGAKSVSFFQNQNLGGWRSLPAQSVPLKPITMKWVNVVSQTADGPGDRLQELIVLSSDLTILGKSSNNPAGDKSQFTVLKYNSANNAMVEVQSFSFGNRAQAFDLASLDSDLASGLFERDHDLDLVLADYVGGSIQYLANEDNNGWFTSFASLDTSANPRAIVLADFDRDGDNDILYTNHLLNKLRLLLTPGSPSGPPCPIYVVDFGDVLIGTKDSLDFPISLYGSLDVNVTVEVQDQQNFDAAPRSLNLLNGQSSSLRLFFTPQDTLEYETKAVLITDYPLENVACFILMRGRGIDVNFNITPSVLDFMSVPPGLSKTLNLDVVNNANGLLALTKLESALPQFSHETDTIYVQPYGTRNIPVTFSPQMESSYLDTLFISSNDITKARVPILLLGKGATGVPRITSADTVTAIEHKFFFYIATAEDPDGDQIHFRFENSPNWLLAGADSLYGVPPEGATDSGFTVIASDGFLEDSLVVYLRVIPVNDPPRFVNLEIQRVAEGDQLTFVLSATDPEGELLSLSAQNLPEGALFSDEVNNSGTFDWTPPFRSNGTYDVTFFVVETVSTPALSDTMAGRILVGVTKGELIIRPNPFTPNGDGKNDFAMFDMHRLGVVNPKLRIFDLNGKRIRTITDKQNDKLQWDGYDQNGREQLPGVYLYILEDSGERVAQGYVVLAR